MIKSLFILALVSFTSYFAEASYSSFSPTYSCQSILQSESLISHKPSWLDAHSIDLEQKELADQFIEAIILSMEGMDEEQKIRFSDIGDSMGLNYAAGPGHLIHAANIALENFAVSFPGLPGSDSLNSRTQFVESLKTQWTDKRNILFWSYIAYERFLIRHYNGKRENIDFFMQVLNSEYHVATTKIELRLSLRKVFSDRFAQDPSLIENLEFEELVEIAFEGLDHFEQKIDSLQSPIDLIGGNGHFRVDQWGSSKHEGPSAGVETYKSLTEEMDLSPTQQQKVIKKVEEFNAAISAGVMLNIMQIKLDKPE